MATETCSGCGVARYCGAFCQHKDWDDHARVCRAETRDGSPDSNNTGENNSSKANNTSSRPPATTTPTTSEASEA